MESFLLIHNQEAKLNYKLLSAPFLFPELRSLKTQPSIVSGRSLLVPNLNFPHWKLHQQRINRNLSNQFCFSLGSSKFSTRFLLKLLYLSTQTIYLFRFLFLLTCNFGNHIWSYTWKHSLTITSPWETYVLLEKLDICKSITKLTWWTYCWRDWWRVGYNHQSRSPL